MSYHCHCCSFQDSFVGELFTEQKSAPPAQRKRAHSKATTTSSAAKKTVGSQVTFCNLCEKMHEENIKEKMSVKEFVYLMKISIDA